MRCGCGNELMTGDVEGICTRCRNAMNQAKQWPQNLPKADACPQLGEVRADIERLQCFTSNHALEENAYIRAIDDVIEIIDKKLASIST